MIYESFQSWRESPVKTTIETLPIDGITFPKITVCPPKGTYTNLNYDIEIVGNMTIDSDPSKEYQYRKEYLLLNKFEDHFIQKEFETLPIDFLSCTTPLISIVV